MTRALTAAFLLMAACQGDKTTPSGETGTPDTDTIPVTTSTGAERAATILALTGDAAAAQSNYSSVCSACHGPDGAGVAPNPALTDRVPALTDEEIVLTILEGKGNMDAYDTTFKNQQIADLLAYLRTNFGN